MVTRHLCQLGSGLSAFVWFCLLLFQQSSLLLLLAVFLNKKQSVIKNWLRPGPPKLERKGGNCPSNFPFGKKERVQVGRYRSIGLDFSSILRNLMKMPDRLKIKGFILILVFTLNLAHSSRFCILMESDDFFCRDYNVLGTKIEILDIDSKWWLFSHFCTKNLHDYKVVIFVKNVFLKN